jgi:hypothetical protein
MTDYEMRAFYQDSSSEESLAARVCAGLDPQRDNLLPKPTSCPDIYGESFLAKKFRKGKPRLQTLSYQKTLSP